MPALREHWASKRSSSAVMSEVTLPNWRVPDVRLPRHDGDHLSNTGVILNALLAEWAAARRSLAEQAALGVVGIDRGRGRRFSGIVWDSDTLVTAAEALHGADSVDVSTAQGTVTGDIIACDLSVDVAVIKAKTGAPGIAAAKSASLASGDDVLVVGRRDADPVIVWSHAEHVGPAWRSRSGGELDRLIRLSLSLHPTLEGGGTFDLQGRLCAMTVRGPRHQTLGIPSESIERVVSTVLQHGRLLQPYLGVRLQPVSLDEPMRQKLARVRSEAVIVVGVESGSPAADAGLLLGDLIDQIAGNTIENAIDLKVALSRLQLGSSVGIKVHRAGMTHDATVIVRERSRP
jgi:S1-C subfamily serine protease